MPPERQGELESIACWKKTAKFLRKLELYCADKENEIDLWRRQTSTAFV